MVYFNKNIYIGVLVLLLFMSSCQKQKQEERKSPQKTPEIVSESAIVDCNYSFDEAIEGSKAPESVLKQLELFTVRYYSFDRKLHQGQILCNKKISKDLKKVFVLIEQIGFPVGKVIPAVRYKWDDDASMEDNNSYSFCYRNVEYSKHAIGMAMDINPFQNPVRWNEKYKTSHCDKPTGAIYDPDAPGTFYPEHPVVRKFSELGFRWGRTFHRNDDDHHFEK
jgi:hypothetical protein